MATSDQHDPGDEHDVEDSLVDAVKRLDAYGTSCWDCWFFKQHGLCCPTHATAEEKARTDHEVMRRLYSADAWLAKKERTNGE